MFIFNQVIFKSGPCIILINDSNCFVGGSWVACCVDNRLAHGDVASSNQGFDNISSSKGMVLVALFEALDVFKLFTNYVFLMRHQIEDLFMLTVHILNTLWITLLIALPTASV